MKNSHGSSSILAIISLIMFSVAAVGWYYYYSEVDKNKSLTSETRAQLEALNLKLKKLQSTISQQRETQGSWQNRLDSQKALQGDLTALMRIAREEKEAMEVAMQQEARRVTLITADLETELAVERTMQNILHDKISSLNRDKIVLQNQLEQARKTRLQLTTLLDKAGEDKTAMEVKLQEALTKLQSANADLQAELLDREARIQVQNDEITVFSAANTRLLNQLKEETESRNQITRLLEKTTAEKATREASLQEALTGLEFSNADLQAELLNREAILQVQNDEITNFNAANKHLQNQLEQEKESRHQITMLLEKTTAEKATREASLQEALTGLEFSNADLQAELLNREAILQVQNDEITNFNAANKHLQNQLKQEKESRHQITMLLEKTTAEKATREASLQEALTGLEFSNADLQAELLNREAILQVQNDEITNFSAANTHLQNQLKQEKESRHQIAMLLEKTTAEKATREASLQEALTGLEFSNADLQAELLNREAILQVQNDEITNFSAANTHLQNQLKQEKESRHQIAMLLEKTTAEKATREASLQEALTGLEFSNVDLKTELLNREARIKTKNDEIAAFSAANTRLLNQLKEETESRNQVSRLLEKTTAEKTAVEANLQQQVQRVMLTVAELQEDLLKRQTAQKSLRNKLATISGEKSRLLEDLEQEQKSKQYIANLKRRLELELNESRVEITLLKNQMTVINLTSEVLFSSGSARLKPAGEKVLSIIADALNSYPHRAISVEGHTDNLPIHPNSFYRSNWELSTARGMAAVYYFQENSRVDPKRLKVVGHGQYQPVSSNDTPEGRQQNRRIEIRLLPVEEEIGSQ